ILLHTHALPQITRERLGINYRSQRGRSKALPAPGQSSKDAQRLGKQCGLAAPGAIEPAKSRRRVELQRQMLQVADLAGLNVFQQPLITRPGPPRCLAGPRASTIIYYRLQQIEGDAIQQQRWRWRPPQRICWWALRLKGGRAEERTVQQCEAQ